MRNNFENKLQVYPVEEYQMKQISEMQPRPNSLHLKNQKPSVSDKFIKSLTENQLYLLYPISQFTCILPEELYKSLLQKPKITWFYNTANNKICERLSV